MQANKKPLGYSTRIVCTDGSTLSVQFPYSKRDIFLTNDLNNNIAFYSPLVFNESIDTLNKKQKSSFQFDFYSLMDKSN
jgi:hypothetical protein|tara:strand:- start:3588 stop:3824 length:237 start_codon:yes stop_codon:yes gene_type:complete